MCVSCVLYVLVCGSRGFCSSCVLYYVGFGRGLWFLCTCVRRYVGVGVVIAAASVVVVLVG